MGRPKNTPKKPLKALRTFETQLASRLRCREQIESTIRSIEDLHTAEPKFPNGEQPDVVSILLKGLFSKIQAIEEEITSHPEFPEGEQDLIDFAESDTFELKLRRATAAFDAAHSRRSSTAAAAAAGAAADTTAFFSAEKPRVRFREASRGAEVHEVDVQEVAVQSTSGVPPTGQTTYVLRNSKEFDAAQRPETFRGDRLKFRTFMKQFEIFISKNPNATDSELLMALRRFVADEPKLLVDALELTDANYQIALATLEENYSRVDVDRERLLTELRSLPRVSDLNDVASLRKLVIQVQTNTKVLESLGVRLDSIAVMVQSSLTASLPPALRQTFKQWKRVEVSHPLSEPSIPNRGPSSASASSLRRHHGAVGHQMRARIRRRSHCRTPENYPLHSPTYTRL